MNLNNDEMKEYLNQVVDLESSIYMQERSRDKAKSELKFVEPTIEHLAVPERKSFFKPVKPVRKELTKEQKDKRSIWIILLCGFIAFFLLFLGFGIYSYREWQWEKKHLNHYPDRQGEITFAETTCAIFAILTVFPGVIIYRYNKALDDEFKKDTEQYEKSIMKYNEMVNKEEERYSAEMAVYQDKKAKYKQQYDEEYAIAENNYKKASQLVSAFDRPLTEAKSLLERLYALDYIFPKYRNLIAMCTIYEYYMTGRVSELEGPNGAYNLYESELRQNLIINRLDTIISQLEQVKENQFILYQEVRKTNIILNGISKDIKEILDTSNRIENNTELIAKATNLTAYYSQIIAHNTEAIKYLELVNG